MVHFHIHTNGYTEETDDAGHHMVVKPFVVNIVWIGLGVLLWLTALFIAIEAIRGIKDLV